MTLNSGLNIIQWSCTGAASEYVSATVPTGYLTGGANGAMGFENNTFGIMEVDGVNGGPGTFVWSATASLEVRIIALTLDGTTLTSPSESGTTQRLYPVWLPPRDYGDGGIGATYVTGGTIGGSPVGFVSGDWINLTAVDGTQGWCGCSVGVVSVNGSGTPTAICIMQAGQFTSNPTSFTQASTSGSGTGFQLTSPTFSGPSAGNTLHDPSSSGGTTHGVLTYASGHGISPISETTDSSMILPFMPNSPGGAFPMWPTLETTTTCNLYYKKSTDTKWTIVTGITTTYPTSYTVSGLSPATTYNLKLGYVAPSSGLISLVNINSSYTTYSLVRSLAIESATSSSLTASWLAPTYGDARSHSPAPTYTLQYRKTGDISWTQITGISSLSQAVTGLLPSTSYDFQAAASYTAQGSYPAFTTAFTATATGTTTGPPGVPTSLTFVSATPTSITMDWTAPVSGAPVVSYTLQYRQTGTTAWTQILGISYLSYDLSGLMSGTQYDFQVQSVGTYATSAFTATTIGTTQPNPPNPPAPPAPVTTKQTLCPGSNESWSFVLPPPMQYAVFDLVIPPGAEPIALTLIPMGLLSVVYQDHSCKTFIRVPQTVATAFQYAGTQQPYSTPSNTSAAQQMAQNQINFFNRQIAPVYKQIELNPTTNCPVLDSSGKVVIL